MRREEAPGCGPRGSLQSSAALQDDPARVPDGWDTAGTIPPANGRPVLGSAAGRHTNAETVEATDAWLIELRRRRRLWLDEYDAATARAAKTFEELHAGAEGWGWAS